MSIEWNDKYKVGDTGIDGEHMELFRIANGFLNASGQEAQRKSAIELRKYTKAHFWHEEMLMHDVDYPFIATHLKLHENLIAQLSAIEQKIESGELYQEELKEFINHWFVKHMATVDAPLVVYVKKHNEASALSACP